MNDLGWLPEPEGRTALPEPAFDRVELEKKWQLARRELEQAAEWGKLPDPGSEFVYSPHLEVLKTRIALSWPHLADPETLASYVALVAKMQDDVGATLYGFAILTTALLEAGRHLEAEGVADLQTQYLRERGFKPGMPDVAEEAEAETDAAGAAE